MVNLEEILNNLHAVMPYEKPDVMFSHCQKLSKLLKQIASIKLMQQFANIFWGIRFKQYF